MMAAALEQPLSNSKPNNPADATAAAAAAAGPGATAASITPPQSANGKKEAPDGVPSELSDLELDQKSTTAGAAAPGEHRSIEEDEEMEEEEEIEPDHYYGGGRIPVFKPVCAVYSWLAGWSWWLS